MLENIFTSFLIIAVPVALYTVSCLLIGNANKRRCGGCGLSQSCGGSCNGKKEENN